MTYDEPHPPSPTSRTRRRGSTLETALLDAAWAELTDIGYRNLSIPSVAVRANTGRAVLYRRWADKAELVRAALHRQLSAYEVTAPNSGDLRTDVLEYLSSANERRARLLLQLTAQLGEYLTVSGETPTEFAQSALNELGAVMHQILRQAEDRGELRRASIPALVADLPADLLRQRIIMTMGPVSPGEITAIVDVAFLPLVRWHAAQPATS